MELVFSEQGITIYHGDCMEYMATLTDRAFSLAVVDPPYGIETKISVGGGRHTKSTVKFHNLYKEGGWKDKKPDKDYFDELRRVTQNQVICGGNYFSDMLPVSRGWAIYDKMQDRITVINNELIYTSFDMGIKTFRRFKGLDNGFMNPEGFNIHPTQKPIALYRWLLTNYARPGDIILDTHLGSGSSAIAAYELGFEFVGIELDTDYYNAAVERFKKRLLQPKLPLELEAKPTQGELIQDTNNSTYL